MSLRKILEVTHTDTLTPGVGVRTCKVYKDTQWGEYQVHLLVDGRAQVRFTYHTDSKKDAIATANVMVMASSTSEPIQHAEWLDGLHIQAHKHKSEL